MSSKSSVNVSVLGCLPFLIGCLILGGLGFCGDGCQQKIVGGVKAVSDATK